jgi:tetratricopeptide (TPR) repeat protein
MLVGLKEDAITMYKKAIALDPKLRRAYINLADLYHTLGIIGDDDNEKSAYLAKAFAVLENFLEIQPNDEYALAALVDVAITGRRYKEAVAVSLELVKIKPEDFNAQKALGMAYLQAGSPAEAVKAFEKASDLKLNDLESMRYLGIALATSGQRKRALMILKRIVPDQFGLYFGLGMNAVFDKKIDDAVEYFEQAVSIEPDSTDAIYQLALSYSSAGNRQAALEQHAKLKKISPEDAEELFERINR